MVVGISNDGSATLYDLVNIADKNIAEALNATVGSDASRRGSASVQFQNTSPSAKSQGENVNSEKREMYEAKARYVEKRNRESRATRL